MIGGITDEQWADVTQLCTDSDPKVATLADSVRQVVQFLKARQDAERSTVGVRSVDVFE